MWYAILPQILNMSLTAGIAAVFVLFARLLLKKAPKIFSYALWSVVLFRLVCPVSFSMSFSLLEVLNVPTLSDGSIAYIPPDIVHTEMPRVALPVPGVSEIINGTLPQGEEQLAADPLEALVSFGTWVWLAGTAVMLIYGMISLLRLRRTLVGSVLLRDNIYLADHIPCPFVIGVLRPKIYLPSALPERERDYIIVHEQTHIRRFDPIVKIIAFWALAVHWFNPLAWLSFILCDRDMEMSCDESVMKQMNTDIRKEYSASLLSLATGKKIAAGMPLAFGEGDTKSRIKNVLNYKKPPFWVIAAGLAAVMALCIGLAANPANTAKAFSRQKAADPIENGRNSGNESIGAVTVAGPDRIAETVDVLNDGKRTGSSSANGTPHANAIPADTLERAVSKAILEYQAGGAAEGVFTAEAHTTLAYGTSDSASDSGVKAVTVYAMALKMEFRYQNGSLREAGGSHMPVAITFDVGKTGTYTLNEYWTPQDGAYYAPSIREKFPKEIAETAMDTQRYIQAHMISCYEQAISAGKLDMGSEIAGLIGKICSPPAPTSDPKAYMDAHPIEYRTLVCYGDNTLDYCFSLFERGGQTGLEGHIMAGACRDILMAKGMAFDDILYDTGQGWYDSIKDTLSYSFSTE